MRFAAVTFLLLAAGACSRDVPEFGLPTGVIERGEAQAGAGLYSSLAVDELGHLHAAYFHADLGALRHAHWEEGSWNPQTVDEPDELSETGRHAVIRAYGSKLAVAYQKTVYRTKARESIEAEELWFAEGDAAGWTTQKIDPSSFRTGDFISLVILEGQPVVAYYESTNKDLMLASRHNGAWSVKALEKQGDVGAHVSMAAGADGHLHLAYYDGSAGGLKYAMREEDGEFTIDEVDGFAGAASDANNVGTWAVVMPQPQGVIDPAAVAPKILYYDESRRVLRLAEREGRQWKRSVVDDQAFVGTDAALVWLPDGDLVAAYFDGYNLDLRLARRSAAGWSYQTLLSQGAVGMYNAMTALPNGKLALTTYNLSRGELDYLLLPVRP